MKLLCIRSAALRLVLCATIASVTLAGTQLSAQDATDDQAAQPPVSEMYDADFAKHVDLRMLGIAWQSLDAKLMTDVALQLREGEKVLGRKHPKITSDQILAMASKVAADSEDLETLERLTRVAEASGNQDQVAKMKQIGSLAAKSRDLKGDLKSVPMFSAEDVNNGALAAFANLILQIRAAKVTGDKDALGNLKEATDLLTSLQDSHRSRLKGLIDDAMDSIGDPDDAADALQKLTGPSRDLSTRAAIQVAPNTGYVSANPPAASAIIVAPPVGVTPPPTSSGPQVSYATGGMQYLMTPSGAVVQSYGRIGSILFEPGDVILAIGGFPLGYGATVDSAINAGYVSQQRRVTVRDRNSGRVLNLFY